MAIPGKWLSAAVRTSAWCAGVQWPKDRNPILFMHGTSETVESKHP